MMTDLIDAFARSRATLAEDIVGAAGLVVMLVTLLHLPAFY